MTKRYGSVCAVEAVDLVVRRGSIVGLIGPNGSGKTTVLHIAAGLVRADSGRATVMGACAGSREARQAAVLVPDDPAGFDDLSVDEFVALAHALWGVSDHAQSRATLLSGALGFAEGGGARLGELSRGRRRQAFVLAALSLAPSLVLVDEATATLDPEAVVVLREGLGGLAQRGTGVLLATQDLHFAETVCDRLAILDRGVVVAHGSPSALCKQAGVGSLEEAFLALCSAPQTVGAVRGGLASL